MCCTTISKKYSKKALSKIWLITERQNVLEKISSDLVTLFSMDQTVLEPEPKTSEGQSLILCVIALNINYQRSNLGYWRKINSVRRHSSHGRPQKFFQGREVDILLSFSVCWRCNANGRTQKQNVQRYGNSCIQCFPWRKTLKCRKPKTSQSQNQLVVSIQIWWRMQVLH